MDKLGTIKSLFGFSRALIGVVHLQALPGTPGSKLDVAEITSIAVDETRTYEEAGFNGVMIENTHDRPYLKSAVGPEITAAMAVIGTAIRKATALPLGIQVLAGANSASVAVAFAVGASFVRVEGFVFAHVADEGLIEGSAGALLRYRRAMGAEHIRVFADIKKKHSAHAITADVSLGATAHTVEFMGADCVIVTGSVTGEAPSTADVKEAKAHCGLPVILGSGISADNITDFYSEADGFIVGTAFKVDGLWSNTVDPSRVAKFMSLVSKLRASAANA